MHDARTNLNHSAFTRLHITPDIFVIDSFDVETDSWNGRHNLPLSAAAAAAAAAAEIQPKLDKTNTVQYKAQR